MRCCPSRALTGAGRGGCRRRRSRPSTRAGRCGRSSGGGQLPDGVRLARSTVHRLLRAEVLMSRPDAAADGVDRRRFSFRYPGQLWMSDVMHGPAVADGGRRRRKTYLIAFLDDALRLCPFAAFAHAGRTFGAPRAPLARRTRLRSGRRVRARWGIAATCGPRSLLPVIITGSPDPNSTEIDRRE